jgi:hypothetical protein
LLKEDISEIFVEVSSEHALSTGNIGVGVIQAYQKEVIPMNIEKTFDIVESFMAGFGNRDSIDINNAIFIAIEFQKLSLPIDFKGAGRLGVESPKLYRILRDAKPDQENQGAFYIGRMLSEFDSRELMIMASYLWNEGKNCLKKDEKTEALTLLQEKFNMIVEKEKTAKRSSATATG